ncbi:MAG: Arc family DNA-binding protein [Phormidium sp. GEM2.Bin31]|nr:Arc family DNA-binding protein [Phormidium sp. BM_Day4_Bin.17]TVR14604.1 MAG: Arc family DNA-binding protein [Phormidium sp. GEM2.Bin31]UCJ11571.1 MAG: Arc family DNA-binding protein [Phormidium sp. PBR-2020]
MTHITLNHLNPQITEQLQQRASENGRTVEAEIAAILESVLNPKPSQPSPAGLATAIQRRFADIEDFEIPEMPRDAIRTPPTFE